MATRVSECLILQYLDHFDDVSNCVDSCSERATREFEILRYFFVYFSHRSIRKACSSWSSKKKFFLVERRKFHTSTEKMNIIAFITPEKYINCICVGAQQFHEM